METLQKTKMKVLIVGSVHYEGAEAVREQFVTACKELGVALARAGIEIVVGSDSPNTADRYIVEGMSEVEGKHRVWIFRPGQEEDTPFAKESGKWRERIEFFYKKLQ